MKHASVALSASLVLAANMSQASLVTENKSVEDTALDRLAKLQGTGDSFRLAQSTSDLKESFLKRKGTLFYGRGKTDIVQDGSIADRGTLCYANTVYDDMNWQNDFNYLENRKMCTAGKTGGATASAM